MKLTLLTLTLALFLSCQHTRPGPAEGGAAGASETGDSPSPLQTLPAPLTGPQRIAPWASPRPPFQPVSVAATYLGSATCLGCHSEASSTWKASAHAHALETLKPVEAQFNPSCFRCHTTGAGWATGYQNEGATPQLAQVGCESCHGPASEHIGAPAEPYGGLPTDAASCLPCHTQSNSPDFVWADYWPSVAHGRTE